jgi:hypothetical protein
MSWLAESEANNLERTYINTFLDVSGNIIHRKGYLTVLDGDVSFNNGNLYVGGNITGNYLDKSIPASAIDGQVDAAPNFNGNVQMNGNLIVEEDLLVKKNIDINGIATAPTIVDNADNTNNIATTAFVQAVISTLDAGPMATNIANNTTAITNEETRATAAETALQTNIDTNSTAITSEETRATAAETALQTNIDTNATAITSEETRATAAETALQTDIALKANIDSPELTGIPTAPTAANTTDSTQIATTAFVQSLITSNNESQDVGALLNSVNANTSDIALKANIDSPVLTGIPEAPTAANTTDTDQIATTKFVQERITTIIGGAPAALDTLKEITDALTGADSTAGAITTTITDNKTAIEAEVTRATAAETTLQSNIDAVSGNLSLNGLSDVKFGGGEFTDSLLIGTTSTGVLDDAKENTGVGSGVFNDLTSGNMCTAIGFQSLYSNTTGGNNTAVGNIALYTNTTGLNNTAVGKKALYSNTTGLSNVANGSNALYTNATGSKNIANGSYALYNNTEGNNNVAIGHEAGNVNVTGDKNTYIGHGANAANGETALSNSTAIGYDSKITASNQIMLGTAAEKVKIPGTELSVGGDVIFTGGLKQKATDGTLSDFRGGAFNIDETGDEFAHYSNAIHIGGSTRPVDGSKLEVTGDVKITGKVKISSGAIKQW